MKYHQPYGITDPDAPYINGNPSTGTMGSIPPAASIEFPMREIVEMIKDGGFAPDDADLRQLAKAIQSCFINYVVDTGTVNALNVTMNPAPLYRDGLVIRTKVVINNTGPATINVNAQGAKKVRRKGDTDLLANDLAAGSIAELTYNSTLGAGVGAFELSGASQGGTTGPSGILTTNKHIYVDPAIGNDINDGTDATAAHALRTLQRAVDVAFSYMPSQYAITIHGAAGHYPAGCRFPTWGGPHIYMVGAGPTASFVHAANDYAFLVQGPGNWCSISGWSFDNTVTGLGPPGIMCGSGSYVETNNTASGNCTNGTFEVQGAGLMLVYSHTWNGTSYNPFYVMAQGQMGVVGPYTINAAMNVSQFCNVADLGILIPGNPPPTFAGAANVIGRKFYVFANGVIDANGFGLNLFPGNSPGVADTGGVYRA